MIKSPKLGFKDGYVEVEVNRERKWKNIETGVLLEEEDRYTEDLDIAKKYIIKTLSNKTKESIENGIDVITSFSEDSAPEHFSLTETDQTNIDSMFSAVVLGATEYSYHADGKDCIMYPASDIISIYITYKSFVTYSTTYYNKLKKWINRLETTEEVRSIYYGEELPEDLKTEMDSIISSAQQQVDIVINKITNEASS